MEPFRGPSQLHHYVNQVDWGAALRLVSPNTIRRTYISSFLLPCCFLHCFLLTHSGHVLMTHLCVIPGKHVVHWVQRWVGRRCPSAATAEAAAFLFLADRQPRWLSRVVAQHNDESLSVFRRPFQMSASLPNPTPPPARFYQAVRCELGGFNTFRALCPGHLQLASGYTVGLRGGTLKCLRFHHICRQDVCTGLGV